MLECKFNNVVALSLWNIGGAAHLQRQDNGFGLALQSTGGARPVVALPYPGVALPYPGVFNPVPTVPLPIPFGVKAPAPILRFLFKPIPVWFCWLASPTFPGAWLYAIGIVANAIAVARIKTRISSSKIKQLSVKR